MSIVAIKVSKNIDATRYTQLRKSGWRWQDNRGNYKSIDDSIGESRNKRNVQIPFFFGATSGNRKVSPMSEKEKSKATDRRFLFARPNERPTIRKFRERSTGKNPAG